MRVSVLQAAKTITIEDRPAPEPKPGEVVVRVDSVGVCGSDVHYYEEGRIGPYIVEAPLILGHEAAGEIVAVGEGVDSSRIGERVSIEPGVPDLICPQCLAGKYNLCPNMRFFATPPIDGAFAEYVAIHQAFAYPVPESISDDAAALLEPLSVALWACRKAAITAGTHVLINGSGPIGLVCVQAAAAFGATDITVADIKPQRLAVAERFGANTTINVANTPLEEHDLQADVLLECAGIPAATTSAVQALGRGGRAVLIGSSSHDVSLPLSRLQSYELQITGLFRYANTWPTAIALVASGRINLDQMVTGRYTLEQAEDALNASRNPSSIKPMVAPQLTERLVAA
jgi:L-iditol 2-dehydrogenase